MRITIPFIGPDYANRSTNVDAQKTVNMYPRVQKPGAKNVIALYSTPGLLTRGIAGVGPYRSNGVEFGGNLYFVSGSSLIYINSSGSAASVGTLSTSGSRCELVAGRSYLMVVDGTTGYTWDGTTFAAIADADFPANPTHVTYLDGYFIVNKDGTDEFYISALDDPISWNALDFEVAAANADNIDALAATYKDLYAIGSKTAQIYYNSGNPDFPFSPYPNGTLEVGIQAPHSLSKSAMGLFFLGTSAEGDVAVVQLNGTQINVVSDDISWDIEQMTTTNDAIGSIYRKNNRTYYVLTFPTEDRSFEYIIEDGFWVERKSKGHERYRVSGIGYLANRHYAGDFEGSNYYELAYGTYTEDGDEIERVRRAQVIHKDGNMLTFHELIVEFEAGVGLVTGQGSDPQAMLRYSDDGGHTWSNELWRSIGKIGEYKWRASWRKLGKSKERIFEIKITDPVDVTIVNAYANVSMNMH